MANIRLKRSAVASKIPVVGDLELGEMAINTNDGKVFIKKDDGTETIVEVGESGSTDVNLDTTNFDGNLSSTDTNVQIALDTLDDMTTSYNYVIKSANYTAVNKDGILADTSAGGFNVTLPAAPADGEMISIVDLTSSFNSNNLVVLRNGNNIMGLAQDMTLDVVNLNIGLIYVLANSDWRII